MDTSSIIEGTVKFRDGKKWKSRWCVMRKLSPVADCLHLQLYRDSKDRYKQGQTKASLSLQHFLGIESGFTLDKESNTIAILCQDVTVVLAFDTRERLIQWQVKIANNLGEDQQYLIQIASTPPKARIAPGPARIHVREFKFSLTTGIPPKLLGVWDIRKLRRYGVVDNRFCVEGGSGCGRGEGLYVFVTDQSEEITKTFQLASEGKFNVRRKTVSRNMSVMESPRRMLQQRIHQAETMSTIDTISAITSFTKQNDSTTIWESTEARSSIDYGDTASVGEAADAQETLGWAPDVGIGRCSSCISKLHALCRSSTLIQTPVGGFTPAWTMEETGKSQRRDGILSTGTLTKSICETSETENDSSTSACRCSLRSPTKQSSSVAKALREHKNCPCQAQPSNPPSRLAQYENYDVPRPLSIRLREGEEGKRIESSVLENYDTPKKIKEHLRIDLGAQECQKRITSPTRTLQENMCPCQRLQTPVSKEKEEVPANSYISNGAIYARVDLQKKTNRNPEPKEKRDLPYNNYENLEFAQSLEHYENVRDFMVRLEESLKHQSCVKCPCSKSTSRALDDYLLMGPICIDERPKTPPYLPMCGLSSKSSPVKCTHIVCGLKEDCLHEKVKSAMALNETKSSTSSPFLRRHEPGSMYSSGEGRNLAALRRRSNSVDSGRCFDGLECISERTSSSTHNTITNNSATASIDSLPTENSDPKKPEKIDFEVKSNKTNFILPYLQENSIARRLPVTPGKTANNRDSSSSNDSGVSTGSLRHCGSEFLEFETLITPLSKVRHHSVGHRELLMALPRRSKSSDPLQDLSFSFEKSILSPKSSSAEAEVPVSPSKKEPLKDLSASCSTGGLTIPYMDSVSTSSGTSDMSDYIDTLSMSSYSSAETPDNLRLCHSAATVLRPRSGKEYQKIDRYNIDETVGKKSKKVSGAEHSGSPSLGYISSTSSN